MIWDYLVGDVREVLAGLPDGSVQCIVTSPPYWGLRDYGIPPSIWGGDPGCEHEWGPMERGKRKDILPADQTKSEGRIGTDDRQGTAPLDGGRYCQHCGAWRGCLGLEPTPEMFIEHMVLVCQGLWRVLRDDGTFWLNLGDCYAHSGACGGESPDGPRGPRATDKVAQEKMGSTMAPGLKPKDLVMMPGRVATALQEDGWWVRSKIIWFKPNPMPESCVDRPTSSYEEIFELTKSGKPTYWVNAYRGTGARKQPGPDYLYFDLKKNITYEEEPEGYDSKAKDKDGNKLWKRENQWRGHDYFYDNDAVRQPHSPKTFTTTGIPFKSNYKNGGSYGDGSGDVKAENLGRWGASRRPDPMGANLRNVWKIEEDEFLQFLRWKAERQGELGDVWKMATQPYPAAHFATFCEKLPELCIKAGTSERGCCPQCGAPWERVVEKPDIELIEPTGPKDKVRDGQGLRTSARMGGGAGWRNREKEALEDWKRRCGADSKGEYHGKAIKNYEGTGAENPSEVKARILKGMVPKRMVGYQQTCDCPSELELVPCVVLDPFAGSGTTLKVARDLGRSAIGIDISAEYKKLAVTRARLDTKDILSYTGVEA